MIYRLLILLGLVLVAKLVSTAASVGSGANGGILNYHATIILSPHTSG